MAKGFAGIEIAGLPLQEGTAQLRLLAPWRDDTGELPAAAAFDRKSAKTALLNVIREWRIIARELERTDPGSGDRTLLEAEDAVLRTVHHRLFLELSRS